MSLAAPTGRPPLLPYRITRPWYGLDVGWMDDGACANDPDDLRVVFFWDDRRDVESKVAVEKIKQRCRETCPVMLTCRAYAVEAKMVGGVWGGMDERERRRWSKGLAARPPSLRLVDPSA